MNQGEKGAGPHKGVFRIPTRHPIAAIHQLFTRACGARAARFPLPPAAPSARRTTPSNQRLPMNTPSQKISRRDAESAEKTWEKKEPTSQSVDILKEIQEWFQNQCDGEWEHARRITLESCDNPGWWLKIDLQGTNLENKKFKEIPTSQLLSISLPWLEKSPQHCEQQYISLTILIINIYENF